MMHICLMAMYVVIFVSLMLISVPIEPQRRVVHKLPRLRSEHVLPHVLPHDVNRYSMTLSLPGRSLHG